MHRCSGVQGNMVGPCTCGPFHSGQGSSAFSMLFSAAMPNQCPFEFDEAAAPAAVAADMAAYEDPHASPYSSPSTVDCTLSLGTPSTRRSDVDDGSRRRPPERRRSSSSFLPDFCWGGGNNHAPPRSSRGGAGNPANNDPLFARRCANCDTTSTPLWRNGPRGPKSLCNACGIRFKKEERRSAATANSFGGMSEQQQQQVMSQNSGNPWPHQYSQDPPNAMSGEFRFMDTGDYDSNHTTISYLPWQLNVAVNDFTGY